MATTQSERRPARDDDWYILFLHAVDVHEHSVQPKYALFQGTRMLCNLPWLRGCLSARFALHHDVEVDELVCQSGHVVCEAEGVFSNSIRCEDKVSLPFSSSIEQQLVVRVLDVPIDIKCASGLYLEEFRRSDYVTRLDDLQQSRTERRVSTSCGHELPQHTPTFSPALSTSAKKHVRSFGETDIVRADALAVKARYKAKKREQRKCQGSMATDEIQS